MANGLTLVIVSWVSLFVTLAGFTIALWQIRIAVKQAREARSAAEAGRDASLSAIRIVRNQERHEHISLARRYLEQAKHDVMTGTLETCIVHMDLCASSLNALYNLTDEASEKRIIRKNRNALKILIETFDEPVDPDGTDRVATQRLQHLRRIEDEIDLLGSKIRYQYRLEPDNE